jgi:hypothetical protein
MNEDQLKAAYQEGFAAGERGEEAMPGCTANALGRAWLEGYLDAFRTRAPVADESPAGG